MIEGVTMDFNIWFKEKVDIVNKALYKYCDIKENKQNIIYESMNYSLFAGGKRMRAILMLGVYEMFKEDNTKVLPFACSMEMIHTYSLIHDDLPAMDDDDFRRGKPSNHKKYGEALAILAGDALLNKAFELMLSEGIKLNIDKHLLIKAMSIISESSGTEGMIGGQVVDIFCDDINDLEGLRYLQKLKTGAIIKSSALVGGVLGGASQKELLLIETFANKLGLAFQIKDDILDIEGDAKKLGKPIGSDQENNKKTYVSMIGMEESKRLLKKLTVEAIGCLEEFGDKSIQLINLCKFLLNREY